MPRNRFDRQLELLHQNLTALGALVEKAVDGAVTALVNRDVNLAESTIEAEKDIHSLARTIESDALKILLTQAPVASDLRIISTALKIVTDMERIGKQTIDICGDIPHMVKDGYKTKLVVIPQMGEKVRAMGTAAIDSFVNLDQDAAKKVIAMDDDVDKLFEKVKDNMIALISKDPLSANHAIYLMMAAKHLEKIGDHAENIAEWVVFCKTGERKNVRIL